MISPTLQHHLARWHLWLAGLPLVRWTVPGLSLVNQPLEQVRGEHLHQQWAELPLHSKVSALRTQSWRIFNTTSGLHIMNLDERKETSHPGFLGLAILSFAAVPSDMVLLVCRHRATPG